VIEFSVDLRDRLEEFSQGTLSVSAGIGVYTARYPISVSAQEVARLEDASKSYPDAKAPAKNAVTVFGKGQTYSWDEWKSKVTGEKLKLLADFLGQFHERGNAFLYHLLDLIRGMDDRINLARFAYVLTRLEPEGEEQKARRDAYRSFVRTMYEWVQNTKDRRELVTAIYLYVYLNRKKEEENREAGE
jgi:CRISPR-associated protein Csm1